MMMVSINPWVLNVLYLFILKLTSVFLALTWKKVLPESTTPPVRLPGFTWWSLPHPAIFRHTAAVLWFWKALQSLAETEPLWALMPNECTRTFQTILNLRGWSWVQEGQRKYWVFFEGIFQTLWKWEIFWSKSAKSKALKQDQSLNSHFFTTKTSSLYFMCPQQLAPTLCRCTMHCVSSRVLASP